MTNDASCPMYVSLPLDIISNIVSYLWKSCPVMFNTFGHLVQCMFHYLGTSCPMYVSLPLDIMSNVAYCFIMSGHHVQCMFHTFEHLVQYCFILLDNLSNFVHCFITSGQITLCM